MVDGGRMGMRCLCRGSSASVHGWIWWLSVSMALPGHGLHSTFGKMTGGVQFKVALCLGRGGPIAVEAAAVKNGTAV